MKHLCCLFSSFMVLFLCIAMAYAGSPVTIEMAETDWTWEEKNIAMFEGKISSDNNLPDKIVLKLSLAAYPEDEESGEVVFNTVNGKKLTLRKQKSEYTFEGENIREIQFAGSWKTPETVLFTKTEITLTVYDENETSVLAEKKMTVSRNSSDLVIRDDGKIRIRENFTGMTRMAAIAAAVVWILAVIRITVHHKKKRQER